VLTLSGILRVAVAALCIVGINASLLMLRKYQLAQRGELTEPSVVTSPRARIGSVPNARIGLTYYIFQLLAAPFATPSHPIVLHAALSGAVLASLASLYLAYSLLFVTRRPCLYCWTGHLINWTLLALLLWQSTTA
jgi:uncharacterized membrane protein